MELTSFLTTDDHLKLKCDSCKNFLSVFPICISEDKKNICGRCSENLVEGSFIRNVVYETLAQFLKFPCRYYHKGCLENLPPNDMAFHEKACNFQIMKCPTSNFSGIECKWKGSRRSSRDHCLSKHSDLLLPAEFDFNLSESYQRRNLLEHNSQLFIVEQKFNSVKKLMVLSIYNHKLDFDFKEQTCELVFLSTNRSLSVKCFVTSLENKKEVEIPVDAVNEPDDQMVLVLIKFHNSSNVKSSLSAVDLKVDDPFLETLKCSDCKEYILPPIYVINVDSPSETSVYCSDCKNQNIKRFNQLNLSYQHAMFNAKFVSVGALEQIANLLNYPCKYKKSGCLFTSKPSEMKAHLESCVYMSRSCPVGDYYKCTWKDSEVNIPAHICSNHKTIISDSSVITANLAYHKCYILKFSHRLFRVVFAKIQDYLMWEVQIIGSFEEGYMFKLELIDNKNKDNSLIVKKSCQPLGSKQAMFDKKRCYFKQDQVENFIVKNSLDRMITFRIDICKQADSSSSN